MSKPRPGHSPLRLERAHPSLPGLLGSPVSFSFSNAIADTNAALAFLRNPATAAKYGIDPQQTVVIGHGTGGFLTLHLAAQEPHLAAQQKGIASMQAEIAPSPDARPGACGLTPARVPQPGTISATRLPSGACLPRFSRPMTVSPPAGIAFAQALLAASDPRVTEQHMATDHSFSNHRTRA